MRPFSGFALESKTGQRFLTDSPAQPVETAQ